MHQKVALKLGLIFSHCAGSSLLVDGDFWSMKFLILMKLKSTVFLLVAHAFGIILKNVLPNESFQDLSPMFFAKGFIIIIIILGRLTVCIYLGKSQRELYISKFKTDLHFNHSTIVRINTHKKIGYSQDNKLIAFLIIFWDMRKY